MKTNNATYRDTDTTIPSGTLVLEIENCDTGRVMWRFFRSRARLFAAAQKEKSSRSDAWSVTAFRTIGRGEDQYTETVRL